MIYQVTISGHPASKKNSKRIVGFKGRKRVISSKRYMEWEPMARAVVMKSMRPEKPIESAMLVHIFFSMADRRRRDNTNMAEGVMDVLVACGVLKDDCWQNCPKTSQEAKYTGTAFAQVTIDYGDSSEI
jgi:Holliday junction resolvase RusA-like endonuclease